MDETAGSTRRPAEALRTACRPPADALRASWLEPLWSLEAAELATEGELLGEVQIGVASPWELHWLWSTLKASEDAEGDVDVA